MGGGDRSRWQLGDEAVLGFQELGVPLQLLVELIVLVAGIEELGLEGADAFVGGLQVGGERFPRAEASAAPATGEREGDRSDGAEQHAHDDEAEREFKRAHVFGLS